MRLATRWLHDALTVCFFSYRLWLAVQSIVFPSFRLSVISFVHEYEGTSAPLLAVARDNPLAGVSRLIETMEALFLSSSFLLSLDDKSLSSSS